MYRIVFYRTRRGESPVEEFIRQMPESHQKKVAMVFELLAGQGPELRRPYADQVRGRMRELRIQFGRNEYRVFHYFVAGEYVVLLHGFQKKTQALPEREIRTAEARMVDFDRRLSGGELES